MVSASLIINPPNFIISRDKYEMGLIMKISICGLIRRPRAPRLTSSSSSQVSDTENIRKNLAIERMIIEGCDILLDVNQMFVRQGTVIQASWGCLWISFLLNQCCTTANWPLQVWNSSTTSVPSICCLEVVFDRNSVPAHIIGRNSKFPLYELI